MNSLLAKASLILALVPATLAAQIPRVDGTRLQEGVDTMLSFLVRGSDTTRVGRVIDQLAVRSEAGQPVWLRIYNSTDLLSGTRVDSITDRVSDLGPVRSRSINPAGREMFDFIAGGANGWQRSKAGDSTEVVARFDAGTINASSFDLYLRAAPLETGYELSVPGFSTMTGNILHLTAKVVGVERISGVECWRIESKFAGMPVTFWVRKNGRHLEQQLLQMQPGMAMLYRRTTPKS